MPRLRPDALTWREVEGEIVALELATSTYLGINRAGAVLWPALVDGASEAELVGSLLQSYDITTDQASTDVEAFLAPLRARGLVDG